jgi:hypothetical protein
MNEISIGRLRRSIRNSLVCLLGSTRSFMSEEPHEPLASQRTRIHEFIIHKLPRPNPNEVLYVHSLRIETLKQFVLQTRRYSTDDAPIEALAAYEAIGSPQLSERKFACLTAYIAETFHGRATQGSYSEGSNLGLIVNRDTVGSRVLIFNGDVATLGRESLRWQHSSHGRERHLGDRERSCRSSPRAEQELSVSAN